MTKTKHLSAIPDLQTLVRSLATENGFFLLDSAREDSPMSTSTWLGVRPSAQITIDRDDPGDAILKLEGFYHKHRKASMEETGFKTGFLGFLSYDLGHAFLGLAIPEDRETKVPLAQFGYYPVLLELRGEEGFLHWDLEAEAEAMVFLNQLEGLMPEPDPDSCEQGGPFRLQEEEDLEAYLKKIRRIRDYIYEGEVYQVNYTRQFAGTRSPLAADELYLCLREMNPAPFAAYLKGPDWSILSSSPERLIRCQKGILQTKPIKGTVAVGSTPAADSLNRAWLMNSQKDRSELLMIVDLERNDLAKVSKPGTVRVDKLFEMETYETVHHLVATVSSMKRSGLSPFRILEGVFPGGSITGTPKRRSMEIIAELEDHPRGVYTGSIGYIGNNGDFDFNIAIRTIIQDGSRLLFNAGGGITWKSDAEAEFMETEVKALGMKRGLRYEV